MERNEYDPGGGNYLPVSKREMASTLMVLGVVLLIAGGAWGLFIDWDVRAGNMFMRVLFAVDMLIALSLLGLGFLKKNRLEK